MDHAVVLGNHRDIAVKMRWISGAVDLFYRLLFFAEQPETSRTEHQHREQEGGVALRLHGPYWKPLKKKCPEDVLPLGARSRESRVGWSGLKAVVDGLELGLELGNIPADGGRILLGEQCPCEEACHVLHFIGPHADPS